MRLCLFVKVDALSTQVSVANNAIYALAGTHF